MNAIGEQPLTPSARCFSVRQLAAYWRCQPAKVRELVRRGVLEAFALPGSKRLRISPEAVREAERLMSAGKAKPRRPKATAGVDPEVAALLDAG